MKIKRDDVCQVFGTGQYSENASFLLPSFVRGCIPSLEASHLKTVFMARGKQTISVYTAEKPRILYNTERRY